MIEQARILTISVYSSKDDHKEDFDLGKLRVYKFLNNKSTLLKLLPPTEAAFKQHTRRAALATLIDKSAHIAKPVIPEISDYGWKINADGRTLPCPSNEKAWPQDMSKAISCNCMKGCIRNCLCEKKKRPCYEGCRCQGLTTRCRRMIAYIRDSDDENA